MKLPWTAGRVLTPREFKSYHKQVVLDCQHCSYRPEDYLPLLDFALLMKPGEWPKLASLTEKLSVEVAAAEKELLRRPELYGSLGLRRDIARILRNCSPRCQPRGFAQVMRFDFYFTEEGWRFSEANPDTPSGYVEAYGLTRAMEAFYPGYSPPPNPAAAYAEAMYRYAGEGAMVAIFHWHSPRIARQDAEFILKEVENRGMRGVLASRRNFQWKSNCPQVLTPSGVVRPDLLVRTVSADWLPKLPKGALWQPWYCGSRTPMSYPGFSILAESKRLPLIYKDLSTPMSTCRAFSPESRSPVQIPLGSRNEWVFKRAFGSAGQGVGLAGVTKKSEFKKICEDAQRDAERWVAQRRFDSVPVPTERGPGHVCIGIFTIDGVAAGAWGRIKGKPLIDHHAISIPILIPQVDLESQIGKGKVPYAEKFNVS